MESFAVWSRVFAPSAGGRWEERLLWDCDALGEDLRHLPPLGREQQKISALLRGIRSLEGGKALTAPPRPRREGGLRGCYFRSLALAREFAARAADGGTGPLWQAAAEEQMAQSVRIARILGK